MTWTRKPSVMVSSRAFETSKFTYSGYLLLQQT
jgi:hypothetical protein